MQRYLNKNELKDYLGVSLGTINNKLNELPHIKWGDNRNSRVLFPVEDHRDGGCLARKQTPQAHIHHRQGHEKAAAWPRAQKIAAGTERTQAARQGC